VIGERVRIARESAGLTQTDLSSASGVTQGSISDIEHDRIISPSPEVITCIARATGYPESFFSLGPLPDFPDGSFRKLKRGSVRVSAQLVAQVRLIAEMVQRAESELDLPPVLVKPALDIEDLSHVERLAAEARRYLRVGEQDPIPNLTRSIERSGVIVVRMPLDMPDHDGYSVWPDAGLGGRPLIAVSAASPGDRARFTTAHEFGHLLLHTNRLRTDNKVAESEANRFAGALLVPRKTALNLIKVPVTLGTLIPVKAKLGVSLGLLARRALDLNIIDQAHFISLRKQMSARGWNRTEPVEVVNESTLLIGRIVETMGGTGTWLDRSTRLHLPAFNLRALATG
jgi:Zn-dependent peptidase ImmA (M78 family)/DNA-binding XRE family transcriptional regulator